MGRGARAITIGCPIGGQIVGLVILPKKILSLCNVGSTITIGEEIGTWVLLYYWLKWDDFCKGTSMVVWREMTLLGLKLQLQFEFFAIFSCAKELDQLRPHGHNFKVKFGWIRLELEQCECKGKDCIKFPCILSFHQTFIGISLLSHPDRHPTRGISCKFQILSLCMFLHNTFDV